MLKVLGVVAGTVMGVVALVVLVYRISTVPTPAKIERGEGHGGYGVGVVGVDTAGARRYDEEKHADSVKAALCKERGHVETANTVYLDVRKEVVIWERPKR